jgi:hypothetical protein
MRKSSAILRAAARRIEREGGGLGCVAIWIASGRPPSFPFPGDTGRGLVRPRVMQHFSRVAPHADSNCGNVWWTGPGGSYDPVNREPRIIGLCLAAAIAESEGD